MFMEHVLEHVAKAVGQDPIVIKQKNLYQEGQMDISRETLTNFKLREISHSTFVAEKYISNFFVLNLFFCIHTDSYGLADIW